MGFSQKKAHELQLTPKELVFLRWFIDFMVTMRMKHVVAEKTTFYWIDRKTVNAELPILQAPDPSNLRRFLRRLVKKKVLKHYVHKGNEAYYATDHETMSELLSYVPRPARRRRGGGCQNDTGGVSK